LVDVPSLELYSGDEPLTMAFLAEGAIGVVGVATHWCAPETGDMIRAFEKGDVVRAREINARLRESFVFMNSDTCVFSQAAKAMMRTLGLKVGECRLPLGAAPAGTEERAREVYANLHA
jgi:4-hydroxy-tetrahydrodipicolinate synthase